MRFGRILLSDLADPPDTSSLVPCDGRETNDAVQMLVARFIRRRCALERAGCNGAPLERILGALRRLHSSRVCAYRAAGGGILVSEEFGAVARVGAPAPFSVARALAAKLCGRAVPPAIVSALASFGEKALLCAANSGLRMMLVPQAEAFVQHSPAVAALVPDIDRWQAPPAGLFVLEERLILLRGGAVRMAAAHEFAHALDSLAASKPRSYHSFENENIRAAYAGASGFVNEYAASGLDEYFAESVRAYLEINDERSSWLPLTRKTLLVRDPRMFAIVEDFFRTRF